MGIIREMYLGCANQFSAAALYMGANNECSWCVCQMLGSFGSCEICVGDYDRQRHHEYRQKQNDIIIEHLYVDYDIHVIEK